MTQIKDLLNDLGYKLVNDGEFFRTAALFRGGHNPTSIRIHKKTGEFVDFGTGDSGSFQDFIEISTNTKISDFAGFLKKKNISLLSIEDLDKPKIFMEKTWDTKYLNALFPHYKFYEDKGINKDSLKILKSGLAQSGSMNGRYTFPIFNSNEKIHGWSGRDAMGNKEAKWKHVGSKTNWVYPFYMKYGDSFFIQEAIKEAQEVILVESIGDMLFLWERGYKNVLVLFGLNIFPKMGSILMGLRLKRIVIATNNDFEGEVNNGRIASLKVFISLSKYIDFQKIIIALPYKSNDFGDISDENFKHWESKLTNYQYKILHREVYKYLTYLKNNNKITKENLKLLKSIELLYNE